MPKRKALTELEAGDTVAIISVGYRKRMVHSIAAVTRVTPTQIIVGTERFRKVNGHRTPKEETWRGHLEIVHATEKETREAEWQQSLDQLRPWLGDRLRWNSTINNMSIADRHQLYELLVRNDVGV